MNNYSDANLETLKKDVNKTIEECKKLIENLTKLKFIITSGLRNKSIDLEAAKKRKIIVLIL